MVVSNPLVKSGPTDTTHTSCQDFPDAAGEIMPRVGELGAAL